MSKQLTLFDTPIDTENDNSRKNKGGTPRLRVASRHQVEMVMASLDDLLPQEHLARDVWQYVQGLNLSIVLNQILAVEGAAGRPATDPKILLALWLYATLKGISSARLLEEYCSEHDAFKWICGEVKVNYHTLSDFRSNEGKQLDELLTESVAILAKNNLISLERASQDGMRVRANAGGSSFKREETLQFNLELATMLVSDLKEEAKKNPGACKKRMEAAQMRSANEKLKNIKDALRELEEVRKSKVRAGKKEQRTVKETTLKKTRASATDPEARVMKMPDSGFRPAYNVQFGTTNQGKGIIGVDVVNSGSDQKQTFGMLKQVEERYGFVPNEWLQDGGFKNETELEKTVRQYKNCTIYMPIPETKKNHQNEYVRQPSDSDIVAEWCERMETKPAQEIYKERASTAEYVNAVARNRGMQQFLVRGLSKVKCVALMFALAHNMMIAIRSWGAC
jgi:transposase